MGYCASTMKNNAAEEGRPDTSQETMDKEVTIVKPRLGWGYCSKDCGEALNTNKKATLKETMLTILTDEECLAFAKGTQPYLLFRTLLSIFRALNFRNWRLVNTANNGT